MPTTTTEQDPPEMVTGQRLPLPDGAWATVELVTPDKAAAWLGVNIDNRKLGTSTGEGYAADMAAGNWTFTGDPIRFAGNRERLLDGQHRLWSILHSGCAQYLMVIDGLPPESQHYMDIGKKRHAKDFLQQRRIAYANHTAAIAKMILAWERGVLLRSASAAGISAPVVLDFIDANPSVVESARIGSQTYTQIRGRITPAGAMHFVTNRLDTFASAEFFHLLQTGSNIEPGHPIHTLQRQIIREVAAPKKHRTYVHLRWYLRAWRAWQDEEELTYFRQDGALTMNDFPMPTLGKRHRRSVVG